MDSTDRFWVDMADPNRYRFERYFQTQTIDPKEGYERIEIWTGSGGIIQICQFYQAKEDCSQEPVTKSITFEEWLRNNSALGTRYIANQNNPAAIAAYEYKGIQSDPTWGDVYIFERNLVLSASDLYKDYPSKETLKFDIAQKRTIEWKQEVLDQGKIILHASSRLKKWITVDRTQIPQDLFSLRQ